MTDDKGVPGYAGRLNDSCVTLAEVLKPAGYFTAMTGKWHVGQNYGVTPWGRGFDRSLNAAAGGFYFPESAKAKLFLNGEADRQRRPAAAARTGIPPTCGRRFGLKFIDEALAEKKPFYLHLCHNAPHFPLAGAGGGYREVSRQIQDRLGRRARPPIRHARSNWASLTRPGPSRRDRRRCSRGKMCPPRSRIASIISWPFTPPCVHRMDKAVGDLVAGLKQRGVFDNTLILFMSDNGGNAEAGPERQDERRSDQGRFQLVLRRELGVRGKHAVPALQALQPRRRHRHAAHRALAAGHRREERTAPPTRPSHRHHGDLRRCQRRGLSGGVQRQADHADGRPQPRSRLQQRTASSGMRSTGSTKAMPPSASAT